MLTHFLTKNRWYESGKTIPMTGIVVHSSGANNPNLCRYVGSSPILGENLYGNHWDTPDQPYGMHAFVGKTADGTVEAVQTLPWNSFLWGCGSGSKGSFNGTHIQFEICEDTTDPAYTRQAFAAAADLCAFLCRECSIPVDNIVGHGEAHKLGYASAHVDPEHWWSRYGLDMTTFRQMVSERLEEVDAVRYQTMDDLPKWAQAPIARLMEKGLLRGNGEGLDLSEDMVRVLVVLERAVKEG